MIPNDDSIALFIKHWQATRDQYPDLSFSICNGIPILSGVLYLKDEANATCDSYLIEIHWKPGYPYRFPWVFEKGGKIPRNIEWHVFEENGNCCIKTEFEEAIQCTKGFLLPGFIKAEIIPYFFNQTFRRLNGYFLNERRHGFLGPLEFFQELLNTKDLAKIISILEFVIHRKQYKGTNKCFCGSNKKYKKCHRRKVRILSAIPNEMFQGFLDQVSSALIRYRQAS